MVEACCPSSRELDSANAAQADRRLQAREAGIASAETEKPEFKRQAFPNDIFCSRLQETLMPYYHGGIVSEKPRYRLR
jgi:hypothetical protein